MFPIAVRQLISWMWLNSSSLPLWEGQFSQFHTAEHDLCTVEVDYLSGCHQCQSDKVPLSVWNLRFSMYNFKRGGQVEDKLRTFQCILFALRTCHSTDRCHPNLKSQITIQNRPLKYLCVLTYLKMTLCNITTSESPNTSKLYFTH